jgi:hypothetical protein
VVAVAVLHHGLLDTCTEYGQLRFAISVVQPEDREAQ